MNVNHPCVCVCVCVFMIIVLVCERETPRAAELHTIRQSAW